MNPEGGNGDFPIDESDFQRQMDRIMETVLKYGDSIQEMTERLTENKQLIASFDFSNASELDIREYWILRKETKLLADLIKNYNSLSDDKKAVMDDFFKKLHEKGYQS